MGTPQKTKHTFDMIYGRFVKNLVKFLAQNYRHAKFDACNSIFLWSEVHYILW